MGNESIRHYVFDRLDLQAGGVPGDPEEPGVPDLPTEPGVPTVPDQPPPAPVA
ncbi:hypothetical protein ACYCFC_08815 [Stutzerimonas sp. NM35]|uniref:hypothetical protein n=1 Tax=Stutzerimonas stutzeri TaxID=316 RepID=UPI0015E36215|nr:hypothetical protein [Stutzerimonas stutzeri]MBA1262007.1 hypothetical protein [Stutzerimonas stutzeri]